MPIFTTFYQLLLPFPKFYEFYFTFNKYLLHFTNFILLSSIKNGFIFFPDSDMHQSYHLVGCYTMVINSLLIPFFTCLVLLISITPSHKSSLNNNSMIIIVKIIMKFRIIKICIYKTHMITKNATLSEPALTNTISSLRNMRLSKSSSILFVRNQSGTSFNVLAKALTSLSHIS